MLKLYSSRFLFITALILGNGLLLTPEGSALRVTGALILFLLPGLVWTNRWLPLTLPFTRWIIGAGLSYSLVIISGLILHYLPGPVPFWAELMTLNILALAPVLLPVVAHQSQNNALRLRSFTFGWVLLLILFLAALFRFTSLGYSEFQGDEVKAMRPAAEALAGHQDALFLYRKKGPAEVLLPMTVWGLMGTINEFTARLPFAIAGLLTVPTIYLLGEQLLEDRQAGLVAAGLLALNGPMVAFSRVVQFPIIVTWVSALALLCVWEWRKCARMRWIVLASIFLSTGLLAHYDVIFVTPALAYIAISNLKLWPITNHSRSFILGLLAMICCLVVIVGLFLLPYLMNQHQVSQTVGYLKGRIGPGLTQNNLNTFLKVHVFYGSLYYVVITGLLALSLPIWALGRLAWVRRVPGGAYWGPGLALFLALGLMIWPKALLISGLDLTALPFVLILLGASLSPVLSPGQRAVVIWLTIPFLIYNFVIALPGAHSYMVIPSWTLLAGLAVAKVWNWAAKQRSMAKATETQFLANTKIAGSRPNLLMLFCHPATLIATALLLSALFSGYLYNAYLRHDLEYNREDLQQRHFSFYWSPYTDSLGEFGIFSYAHRSGWKVIGALFANGQLNGDYGSNEQLEVTSWYIRDRLRSCDPQPKYYFVADAPLGPWQFNSNIAVANYKAMGRVALPNNKGITIYQVGSPTETLGYVDANLLTAAFDRTANPAAFAYAHRESRRVDAHLAGPIHLVGYDLDILEAKPGGQLQVVLYWQTQERISADYHVFVHMEGDGTAPSPSGIWGQSDGRPTCQLYPTSAWQTQQLIPDPRLININPNTPPGDYPILAGIYASDTGVRLDVLDKAGNPVANFVKLTTVTIR